MSDFGYFKFQINGETRYGQTAYLSPSDEALAFGGNAQETLAGKIAIDDAILPVQYHLNPEAVTKLSFDSNEYDRYVAEEEKKAKAISDAIPSGVHVGALFAVGVADGCAWYVVTAVKGTKCDVEWRGFNPDRYYDHWFASGRKNMPKKSIERYVIRNQFLSAL